MIKERPSRLQARRSIRFLLFVCRNARDALADHKRMDVLGSLIGFDRLKVAHVTHNRIIVNNSICSHQIPSSASTIDRH